MSLAGQAVTGASMSSATKKGFGDSGTGCMEG